jgi:hypothetical protein
MEEEWLWLVGNHNSADLGTRSNATPEEMGSGSEYQDGMAWMTEPVELGHREGNLRIIGEGKEMVQVQERCQGR